MTDNNKPEQFSLRWNNFHANLSSGFHSLLQEEDLVDVTIAIEGRFVQAHKIVLSICSPYFKELFKVNPCKHPIVILKDVSYREMTGLLQFMYQGEVSIAQEQLPEFLRAAELLHIKGLTGSESEASKIGRKSVKLEHVKKVLPSPKKKKIEELMNQIPNITHENNMESSETINVSYEPQPGGSSRDEFFPKLEPVDFLETEASSGENVPAFTDEEGTKMDVKTISRLTTVTPGLPKNEGSESQGGFQMTSRGRLQLVRNGYVYHCNRQTEDKIFWKCAEYNRTRCRSRCISVGGFVTVTHANHNHLVRRNYGMPLASPPPPSHSQSATPPDI